ncbi:PREDICTED: uncharacterized protein LOC104753864 isoform X1 [Camelina sativa]|uniref:Uncharacterized protein LOC104753864 isoform X1 n=1 Tax=Camelina sativa TaxID=90675 RepID=A0ABM1R3F9_CAMSA|nr:PREDICTED: uncharacterized protein LOC104753864 isoform X1 [Camelina sativa]
MGSKDSSDKEMKWNIIFNSLVEILRKNEEKLRAQVKRQVSDAQSYNDKLSLMKKEIEDMNMMRRVEIANYDIFKERDRLSCESQLEHAQKELDYLRAWFDFLILSTHKETSDSGGDADCKLLEDKLKKLKLEFEGGCEVPTLVQ